LSPEHVFACAGGISRYARGMKIKTTLLTAALLLLSGCGTHHGALGSHEDRLLPGETCESCTERNVERAIWGPYRPYRSPFDSRCPNPGRWGSKTPYTGHGHSHRGHYK